MKNFAVVVSFKDYLQISLYCVKAFTDVEALAIAEDRFIDNYEYVFDHIKQMIDGDEIIFTTFEIKEEDFK